ncbi:MAG: hypothetical protein JW795_01625 [Chitinivibrionales bacterium]|nr:hypothetical protein [Chitinivibrionales bacterium]
MYWLYYCTLAIIVVVSLHRPSYGQKNVSEVSALKLADSTRWVLIDESDWAVFKEAPSYHFNMAQYYLKDGNYAKAAEELRRGNSFLIFLRDRLSAASKAIDRLAENTASGKVKSMSNLAITTSVAVSTIDPRYTMVPVDVGDQAILNDSYWYHFNQSKIKFLENDRMGAAEEIRKGSSYFKFKAFYTYSQNAMEPRIIVVELSNLASKVEIGMIENVDEMDEVFNKARM